MSKYIDADKLIAEINNRLMSVNLEELGNFGCHRVWAYNDVKDLITSLQQEQPEVELDKLVNEEFASHSRTTEYGLEVTYNRAELYQLIKRMALVFNARRRTKNEPTTSSKSRD